MYGRGPADQPYLYDYPFLRVGQALDSASAPCGTRHDLFRIPGPGQGPLARPDIPLLGDKRNDENKIVSQLHGAIIALHNRIAASPDIIRAYGGDPFNKDSVFKTAVSVVRGHYQMVVLYDYLDKICEPGTVARYLAGDGTPTLLHYQKPNQKYAYMPVEFAVAAFRFGHSMIRPSYALNRVTGTDATQPRIPLFSRAPSAQNLNGFPGTMPDSWGIDWGYFLDGLSPVVPIPTPGKPPPPQFKLPQPSYRIDALLVDPLADLPEFRAEANSWVQKLAFRNLLRGQGLPSGEDVSRALMNNIVTVPEEEMWKAGSVKLPTKPPPDDTQGDLNETLAARESVRKCWVEGNGGVMQGNTPLWYYILREAEYLGVKRDCSDPAIAFGGQHLGPVGSRIVAETLIGLLVMDDSSILNKAKSFKPLPEIVGPTGPTLAKLMAFALGG